MTGFVSSMPLMYGMLTPVMMVLQHALGGGDAVLGGFDLVAGVAQVQAEEVAGILGVVDDQDPCLGHLRFRAVVDRCRIGWREGIALALEALDLVAQHLGDLAQELELLRQPVGDAQGVPGDLCAGALYGAVGELEELVSVSDRT